MILQEVVTDVLLAAAAAVVLVSCLGVLAMPDAYQKLHYVTPAGVVAPVLVALAVTVSRGYDVETTQMWLTAAIMAVASPVVGHATARAIRIREHGDWRLEARGRPSPGEEDR